VWDVFDDRERSERVFEWNDGRGEEETREGQVGEKRLPVVLPDGDRERERKRDDDRVQDETAEEVNSGKRRKALRVSPLQR